MEPKTDIKEEPEWIQSPDAGFHWKGDPDEVRDNTDDQDIQYIVTSEVEERTLTSGAIKVEKEVTKILCPFWNIKQEVSSEEDSIIEIPSNDDHMAYQSSLPHEHQESPSDHSWNVCSRNSSDITFQNNVNNDEQDINVKTYDIGKHHPCRRCGQTFQTEYSLEKHVGLHKDFRLYWRDKREEPHGFIPYFRKPVQEHTLELLNEGAKKWQYRCTVCGQTLASRGHLDRHLNTHDVQLLECDTCGKIFRSRSGITTHVQRHLKTDPIDKSVNDPQMLAILAVVFKDRT